MWSNASSKFEIKDYYLAFNKLFNFSQVYFQLFLLQLQPKDINNKKIYMIFFIFQR